MSNESNGDALVCAVRMVRAPDGADLPVPVGQVAGVRRANGVPVEISSTVPVQISLFAGGYYILMNCAEPENGEAAELAQDLGAEGIQTLLEKALLVGAPIAIEVGLSVAGVLADLLTTSKLTREVFINGTFREVPIRYCILC